MMSIMPMTLRRPFLIKRSYLTLAFCAALFSGCQHIENFETVRPAKAPIVQSQDHNLPLRYDGSKTGLSQSMRAELGDFITRYELTRHDDLTISYPSQGGNTAVKRAEKLQAYLERFGLTSRLAAHKTLPDLAQLTLQVTHYSVQVPNCPDWTADRYDHFNNQTASNFGCATEANFGLMVANPKDLLEGRDNSLVDGATAANPLIGYRSVRPYPLSVSDSTTSASGTGQ